MTSVACGVRTWTRPFGPGPEQLRHARLGDQMPATDHDELVRDVLELAHQVARDEHGAALVRERAQEDADPADAVGIEPVDRLVEHQHRRVAQHRPRDAKALGHPQREATDALACGLGETDQLENLVDAAGRQAIAPREPEQVVAGTSSGMRRAGVEQRPHLAERGPQVTVAPAPDPGVARIRLVEAEDEAHRRRLAGAVGPDEARDAARFDAERQPVDGKRAPVSLRQAVRFDRSAHAKDGRTAIPRCRRAPEPSFATPETVTPSLLVTLGRDEASPEPRRRGSVVRTRQ